MVAHPEATNNCDAVQYNIRELGEAPTYERGKMSERATRIRERLVFAAPIKRVLAVTVAWYDFLCVFGRDKANLDDTSKASGHECVPEDGMHLSRWHIRATLQCNVLEGAYLRRQHQCLSVVRHSPTCEDDAVRSPRNQYKGVAPCMHEIPTSRLEPQISTCISEVLVSKLHCNLRLHVD